MPFVEADGSVVVGKDCQLNSPQCQPVVGKVKRRLHQRRADATSGKIVVHAHADGGNMATSRIGCRRKTDIADHLTVEIGDKASAITRRLFQIAADFHD
ncbi:hypothetical protein D3C85_1665420 [compost metagenome]